MNVHHNDSRKPRSSPRAVATTLAPVVISPRKILHATHISAPITSGQLVPVVSQTPVVSAIHPPHIISQPIPSYTQVMQVTQPQLQQPIVQAPHGVVMHGYPGYSSQPASAPPPALPNPIPMTSYMGNDTGVSSALKTWRFVAVLLSVSKDPKLGQVTNRLFVLSITSTQITLHDECLKYFVHFQNKEKQS